MAGGLAPAPTAASVAFSVASNAPCSLPDVDNNRNDSSVVAGPRGAVAGAGQWQGQGPEGSVVGGGGKASVNANRASCLGRTSAVGAGAGTDASGVGLGDDRRAGSSVSVVEGLVEGGDTEIPGLVGAQVQSVEQGQGQRSAEGGSPAAGAAALEVSPGGLGKEGTSPASPAASAGSGGAPVVGGGDAAAAPHSAPSSLGATDVTVGKGEFMSRRTGGVEGVECVGGVGGVQEPGGALAQGAADLIAWPSMCISTAHTVAAEGQEEAVNAMSQVGMDVKTAGAGARSCGGEGRGMGTSRLRVQAGPSQQQQQQQQEEAEEDGEEYGFSVLDAGDALGPSPRDGSLVKVCVGQVWEERHLQ